MNRAVALGRLLVFRPFGHLSMMALIGVPIRGSYAEVSQCENPST